MAELLEKIPAETCWEITAKTLWRFLVIRGCKFFAPNLGKGDGIIAPVLGAEKWKEMVKKLWSDGARKLYPWVKETFNIPVEDAVGASKLYIIAVKLLSGPEGEFEIVEATPERVVLRYTKCPIWERYEELEVDPVLFPCDEVDQISCEEGFKVVNPKITFKRTKAMPRGDPYCEAVIEFMEE